MFSKESSAYIKAEMPFDATSTPQAVVRQLRPVVTWCTNDINMKTKKERPTTRSFQIEHRDNACLLVI